MAAKSFHAPRSTHGRFGNEKGIALLVTLGVVTVLVTVALALNRSTRLEVESAATSRDRVALDQAALGGLSAAMAILVKDKADTQIDSVQEDWANPEKVGEVVALTAAEGIETTVAITDETSFIQVNALVNFPEGKEFNTLQRHLWERFLGALFLGKEDYGEEEAGTVINSLKDWLDSGDDDAITGLSGAESDYYEELDPPYNAGNGPLKDIEELTRVKGITKELFNGSDGMPGFAQFMTVQGAASSGKGVTFSGKININTASLPALAALLPPEDVELASTLYEYRMEKKDDGIAFAHDLAGPKWYTQAPGCADLKIDANLITTSSDLFRIEVTARNSRQSYRIQCVVQRVKHPKTGQWECKPIAWETD
jgi:general secretion pathway protein K